MQPRTPGLIAKSLIIALACAPPLLADAGGAPAVARWRLPSTSFVPAGRVGTRLFGRDGDELVAIDLSSGKKLWGTKIGNLRPAPKVSALGRQGPRVVVADAKAVYALGETGLYVLALDSGAIMHTQALSKPRGLWLGRGSVYVALNRGVVRFAAGARKQLAASKRFSGQLLGAVGNNVVLYRDLRKQLGKKKKKKSKLRGSPERLTVVDLKRDKQVYEFRLLRGGGHRVVRFTKDRLSFLDYSRERAGKNRKKLFFTEVDYLKNKKLRDLSLKNHYGAPSADTFHARAVGSNGLILVQTGQRCGAAAPAKLLYLDLDKKTVRWTVSRPAPLGAPLRQGALVWVSVAGTAPTMLAVDLANGKATRELSLPEAATSAPRAGGEGALVLRDGKGIVALSTSATVAPASRPTQKTTPAPAGWRLYRDRLAGYVIALPKGWKLNPKHVRHFGSGAFAVPFVRYDVAAGRWRFVASIHVLVRPARAQNVDQLWKAVLAQRRARAGAVKVLEVKRQTRDGVVHIDGRYSFRNRFGSSETARSLCVVSHGVAFELRARMRPSRATTVAPQISKIFGRFHVRPDLKTPKR
jgi:hypothetical protein